MGRPAREPDVLYWFAGRSGRTGSRAVASGSCRKGEPGEGPRRGVGQGSVRDAGRRETGSPAGEHGGRSCLHNLDHDALRLNATELEPNAVHWLKFSTSKAEAKAESLKPALVTSAPVVT